MVDKDDLDFDKALKDTNIAIQSCFEDDSAQEGKRTKALNFKQSSLIGRPESASLLSSLDL